MPNYPLAGLQPGLGTYRLPAGVFAPDQAQILSYEWKFWAYKMAHPQPSEVNIGSVVIERRPSASGIAYQVTQQRDSRQSLAKINCLADDVESVHDWTLDENYPVGVKFPPAGSAPVAEGATPAEEPEKNGSPFHSQTSGVVEGGNAHITRFGVEKVVPLDGPLLCSWALMTNPQVIQHLSASGKKFTLADQMAMLRPGHLARPDITVPVPTSLVVCATFLITGRGSPPTHMIIHPQIGSLFTTLYRSATVLTSIQNAG